MPGLFDQTWGFLFVSQLSILTHLTQILPKDEIWFRSIKRWVPICGGGKDDPRSTVFLCLSNGKISSPVLKCKLPLQISPPQSLSIITYAMLGTRCYKLAMWPPCLCALFLGSCGMKATNKMYLLASSIPYFFICSDFTTYFMTALHFSIFYSRKNQFPSLSSVCGS